MRQEKQKKKGGEKAKSKSQDCCVTFKPKIQEEKKKAIVLCSRPRHNVKLGTFML